MKKIVILLFSLLLSSWCFAQVGAQVKLDPAVRLGTLENGLTYYIRHHDNPKERADFYIVHNVGALQENDDQDGLAHFLEHMAFNGTKHFPKKQLLNFLASNGVMFGSNVNAYTSKTETVYNLSNIPLLRESFIDSVLLILHDWSSYIACEPEEIEAERGVVREEWRRSDEPRSRTMRANAHYEYMDSKYARRTVLGNWDVINNFDRQELLDFYHKWYRPDLQAIIVVGDIDVDEMESRVRRIFAALPKAENPARKEIYDIPYTEETVVGIVTDPDIQYITAKIYLKQPFPPSEERQQVSTLKNELMRNLYINMLGERFSAFGKDGSKAYKKVVAVSSTLSTCRNIAMLTVMPKNDDDLASALEDALVEIKRIEQNGFNEEEFKEAKLRYAKSKNINNPPSDVSVKNGTYVKMYVNHFLRNTPYMEAQAQFELNRDLYDSITADDINAMTDRMITDSERLIILTVNEERVADLPSDELTREILARTDNMLLPQIDAKLEKVDLKITDLKDGRIKHTRDLGYYGAKEWLLSNKVKVVWMPVEDVAGPMKMSYYAYSPSGYGKQNDVAAMKLLERYFSGMGVRGYDNTSLQAALVEHNFNSSKSVAPKNTLMKGTSSEKDFEMMMKMLYLSLTEPNFTPKAVEDYVSRLRETLRKPESSTNVFRQSRNEMIYSAHPWTASPDLASCDRINADYASDIYSRQYGDASEFIFYIIGTLGEEEVKSVVEKYVASLPSGNKSKPATVKPYRRIKGINELNEEVDEEKVTVPKAAIQRDYYGKLKYTSKNNMTLHYLRYIVGERYMTSIREERGGTYYVSVKAAPEPRNKGYHMEVSFETDPQLTDDLLYEVGRAIADLAAEGPSEKELTETKLYLLKRSAERKPTLERNLNYWNDKLFRRYQYGIDLMEEDDSMINSVTADDVRKLASTIKNGNAFTSVFVRR